MLFEILDILLDKISKIALRDCDGTTMPEELLSQDGKIYATYYTTRKDNDWAMHPRSGTPES